MSVFGLLRISERLLTGAAMFKDTESAVSLAGVYTSLTKPALAGVCKHCRLSQADEAGFLPISARKASYNIFFKKVC